ncbi:hypothetical protein BJ085DRAFT_24010 [Dimargaris cristalligena]|uniref:Uncharacterized protein n=2 Tax=Zoopagomycota TaxID=1913638 RepID=A0A4Q0A156_9FUNG|nr:hypothetical protein BJ085DRAFT_24010 [Dimargaris cristalligena]|eukprot:RKP39836.1 hypothetical protein BJ085DRAFT_24010 [Dimargaris cristalligena]
MSRQAYLPDLIRFNLTGGLELLGNLGEALHEGRISTQSRITRLVRLKLEGDRAADPSASSSPPLCRPVAIVTGANSGCGFELTKALLQAGYHVVLACRSATAAEAALDRLRQQTDLDDQMEFMELDLASLASVQNFCTEIRRRFPAPVSSTASGPGQGQGGALQLLVNNAGIMNTPYARTEDGFESQFGVNHVGHFVLTMNLLDLLEESSPNGRIINISSNAHMGVSRLNLTAWEDPQQYNSMLNYGLSKLANLLFTRSLHERLVARRAASPRRGHVTVNAVHPGPIATDLYRYTPLLNKLAPLLRAVMLTPAQGALTMVYMALSSDVKDVSGQYYAALHPRFSSDLGADMQAAQQLWDYTVKKLKSTNIPVRNLD